MSEVIRLMNEFFGTNIKEENQIAMVTGVFEKAQSDAALEAQAHSNTRERFTLGHVNNLVRKWMTETYLEKIGENDENSRQMGEIKTLLSEDEKFDAFAQAMANALYDHFNKPKDNSINL